MNKQRRKDLDKVLAYLEEINDVIGAVQNDLQGIKDEEDEARESVEAAFPNTDRVYDMQAACDALEEALSAAETMASAYDDIVSHIETAQA